MSRKPELPNPPPRLPPEKAEEVLAALERVLRSPLFRTSRRCQTLLRHITELTIAGERADGTVLWMADERSVAEHVVPRITKAADNAGRPAPRIVAGIPVCLCAASEVDAARERANRILGEAEVSPNYQRLLGYGDAKDVGDICAAGDEDAILARLRRFADAGVTDLSVRLLPIGDNRDELVASKRRTREMIASLATELR